MGIRYFAETANAFGLLTGTALKKNVSKLPDCLKEAKSDGMGVALLRIVHAYTDGVNPLILIRQRHGNQRALHLELVSMRNR